MDKLVSVIIPAYNAEKYITETIDSVLNQTWKNIEIIVVDDGSADNTLQVIKPFEEYGVKIFTQLNKGGCAARNAGFKSSSGEFIQFLDADDLLSADKIEKQLLMLLATAGYKNKIIHCKWSRFFKNIKEVSDPGPHESIRRNLKPADWLITDHMSMTGCWLMHRSLIDKGGLWDEKLKRNQDGEFFSRLLVFAEEVLYQDEVTVYYRSGIPNSVSQNNSYAAAESALRAIELIEKYIFSLEKSEKANQVLANKYIEFVYENYIKYPDLSYKAETKVKSLGGATLKLRGGAGLKTLEAVLGWKMALRLKKLNNYLKYK